MNRAKQIAVQHLLEVAVIVLKGCGFDRDIPFGHTCPCCGAGITRETNPHADGRETTAHKNCAGVNTLHDIEAVLNDE